MLEKQIEKYLVDEVRKMGGIAYKWVSPGNDGVPDRIVIVPGFVIFVELKTETGRLTEVQKRQIDRLIRLGQTVKVLHGMEETKIFVGGLKRYLQELEGEDKLMALAKEFYEHEI